MINNCMKHALSRLWCKIYYRPWLEHKHKADYSFQSQVRKSGVTRVRKSGVRKSRVIKWWHSFKDLYISTSVSFSLRVFNSATFNNNTINRFVSFISYKGIYINKGGGHR